jgi:L-aspartate oxidase
MTEHAGVLRSAASLDEALAAVSRPPSGDDEVATAEVANLAVIGRAVCAAAQARTETRGAHSRIEHPDRDPALAVRFVIA